MSLISDKTKCFEASKRLCDEVFDEKLPLEPVNDVNEIENFIDLNDTKIAAIEIVRRVLKYLIEGLAVAIAAYYIPKKKMAGKDIMMIGVTAAATFALLDTFAPIISLTARRGAGFGIGASLVGFGL